jgi:hypothetical protein
MTIEMNELWNKNYNNKEILDNAHRYFYNKKNRIHQIKVEGFADNQKVNFLPDNFDTTKKNIAIFNSTIDEYAAVEGWENRLYKPDETAGIEKILESFKSSMHYVFYLRVHPNMKNVKITTSQLVDISLLSKKYNNLKVIWSSEKIDTYRLMESCDAIITFGSTIGIEAAYWGKPSILLGRALYENLDCIYKPQNHSELVALLNSNLSPLNNYTALKYAMREITHGTPYLYYKETKIKNGLALGKYKNIIINPSKILRLLLFFRIISISIKYKISKYIQL